MTRRMIIPALALCASAALRAQDADRVVVPLTDASRPVNIRVSLLHGSINVRGYDGKEVIVEGHSKGRASNRRTPDKAQGLRRIDMTGSGLSVEEQDNTVRVSAGMHGSPDLTIQAPRRCSLYLRLTNGGGISVENVEGEVDANVTNGTLTLKGISGSAIAHALNSDVTVTFDKVTPDKPMSFSSLNGDIDVTLPAGTKARMKMKTDNGEVYTDFDLKMESKPTPVEESHSAKGRFRIRMDRAVYGTINGGGPDFQFTTLNGKIYIRKK